MRWWLLLGLAGCDQFLKLDTVPAPPDAPVYLVCSQQQPAPFFCADFDDPSAPAYAEGNVATVPAAMAGVTATLHDPAISPGNALWVDTSADTTNNTYLFEFASPRPASTMHGELDIDVTAYGGTYPTEIVEIGIIPTGLPGNCRTQLQLNASGLRFRSHDCPTSDDEVVFGVVPGAWAHIVLDVDLAAGAATANYEGNIATVHTGLSSATGGTPYIGFGVLWVQDLSGPTVAFDNVLVTVQ